jgi:hypothetical protein
MTDKPADISHIFKEQPGIQIQRTSATCGTMNVRLQGLRGKYVQICAMDYRCLAALLM